MKNKIILLFVGICCILCQLIAVAQTNTYRNEWIDYNKTYYKIKIAKDGLVRIPTAVLTANGIPINGAVLKMYRHGQEIPLFVSTNGPMSDGDYVEFIGRKNDGTPDSKLFSNPKWQLSTDNSLFTDTAAYFLTWDLTAANARFQTIANNLSGDLPPKETFYIHRDRYHYLETHTPGEPFHNLGNVNNYYADFGNGEGWVSSVILEGNTMNRTIQTPAAYTAGGGVAQFETRIVGRSDNYFLIPDHHTRIGINGTVVKDTTFEGHISPIFKFSIPIADLSSSTTLGYTAVGDLIPALPLPQTPVDKLSIASLFVAYPHTFDFNNVKSRQFEIDNDGDKYIEISNFSGGTAPILYDLSNRLRLIPVIDNSSGTNIYKFFLPQIIGGEAKRLLWVSNTTDPTTATTLTANQLQQRQFIDYSQAAQQGDYLLVSHPKLMTGDTNYVAEYAAYRQSAQGGGYQPVVVDIEQLYDQFAYGVDKHPLAISHFVNYAMDTWAIQPKLLFLVGKGIMYNKTRYWASDYAACLVPTYGLTPSDGMLVARNSYRPQVGVGRIPALNNYEVGIYLDKIKQYEATPTCSKADNLWRKQALHLSGSSSIVEMTEFLEILENNRKIYENDTLFAGKVVRTFQRVDASYGPTELPSVTPYINNGLNIMYYMGHSTLEGWLVDIKSPLDYSNFGKYPLILSSSCYVGNIHESPNIISMPEEWLFAPNRGAIGMLAGVGFGFPPYMRLYTETLYKNFCRQTYNQPLGTAIQRTVTQTDSLSYTTGFGLARSGVKLTAQEYTLSGDPAIKANGYEQPELVIEYNSSGTSDVSLVPSNLLTSLDSFAVKIALTNLGKWTPDSITIRIDRQLPNGNSIVAALRRVATPGYADTLLIYIPTGGNEAAGDNQFTVTVDADAEISELCEENNSVTFSAFIFSDLLLPIAPCNFSIVNAPQVTLYASTGLPAALSLPYKIEIDTTELFNSPLRQFTLLNSEGGVIKWTVPGNLQTNRVYYWRASQVPSFGEAYNWQYSSFIHLPGADKGWNQSHYYQFLRNGYRDMTLNDNRQLEYTKFPHVITCTNDQDNSSNITSTLDVLQLLTANSVLFGCGSGGGLTFVVFREQYVPANNSVDVLPLISTVNDMDLPTCQRRGTYGNLQQGYQVPAFEYSTHTAEQLDALTNFITNIIPTGAYVLVYSANNHNMNNPNGNDIINTGGYMPALQAFFTELGVPQVNDLNPNQPFIAFGKLGDAAFDAQFTSPTTDPFAPFTLEANFDTRLSNGEITSTRVGPANAWNSLVWQATGAEASATDIAQITVSGITANGTETDLMTTTQTPIVDLSGINADQYPYLRLRLALEDTTIRTPKQLQYWRVLHQPAGELAIDRKAHFVFQSDTVQEGQPIHVEFSLVNASGAAMDSVLVGYTVYNVDNNTSYPIQIPRQAPVGAWQSIIAQATFATNGMAGNNILLIDVNPNGDQLEKFRFNNFMQIPFFVTSDHINPIIDVTFDGRHILNGDLVSASPEIVIRAKDENPYLALNDTAGFSIKIVHPDGSEQPIAWNDPAVQFIPATTSAAVSGNNTARVALSPNFNVAGIYELVVSARDRSNNIFDANQYRIAFEIDPTPKVSNVLNYPNPFTSNTRFVFTLSGNEIPERFSIQIMTVSGRVVRELTQDELGSLYIGRNITETAWDGTDQFGNPLANGLYLYRVVAYIDGKALELRTNNAIDSYFENGIGKMYLMR
ncbi:MAG: hypothetical protein IT273_02205 [Chitinophagales bacterium]|nr:hypothetical protein [Chitinophagales bacterium]